MNMQTFQAITVRPPMSEMIVIGVKNVENRSFSYSSKKDGPLLIHAGKTYDLNHAQWIQDHIGIKPPPPKQCQMGGVIVIADVETTHESHSKWAIKGR